MFLKKKECDFLKLLNKNRNESVYKIGRPLFSTVTITKRINLLEKKGLISKEMVGRVNKINLTKEGKKVLDCINEILDLTL